MAIILESANGGITKTKLLTRASLTSGQLKQYLDILITKKLVVQLADEQRRHSDHRKRPKIPINLFYSKKHCNLSAERILIITCCVIVVPFVIDCAAPTR
jgi:hypothetical protein